MPEKKRVQDIVPSGKRTIRNVAPKRVLPVEELDGEEEVPIRRAPPAISISRAQTRVSLPPFPPRKTAPIKSTTSGKRRLPSILLTFVIIFVGIAVMAVALSLLYSKAAVTITPKTAHIEINGTYTAKKAGDGTATSSSSSSIVYDTVTATQSSSQTVPAVQGTTTSIKAKGTVNLYNEQTTQQKIVAGTRLANADGDVYRTTVTIVIPAGKEGAPGSIAVAVLADEAGAEYNMALTSPTALTVVAYKGTPKYDTVYGKIKTAIAGGFTGTKVTIAPEVQKVAIASLKEILSTKLLEEAKKQIPKESVLYPNAYVIEYETPEPSAKGTDSAEVTVKGTLTGATFKKTPFLKSVAAKELDKFPAPTYSIDGIDDLKFSLINTKDFSPRRGTPLIFSIKGPLDLTGTFSEPALKEELKGTYLKDSNVIFSRYPSIANAYALITPFWMRSFPNSADKIIIEIKK